MDVDIVESPPEGVEADVLGFAVAEPAALPQQARRLDDVLGGRLRRLLEEGELTGESGAVTLVHALDDLPSRRVAAAGVGRRGDVDADALRSAAAEVATRVGGRSPTLAWALDREGLPLAALEQARAVIDGVVLGPYDAGRWKTNGEPRRQVERLVFTGAGAAEIAEGARRAAVVARWTNRCRDLVNAPPNELTPAALADFAAEIAGRFDAVRFHALGPEEIAAAGMGAFTAVARGSENDPRLVTLAYEPDGAGDAPVLGLVGKALTFDAGGISLKPADSLDAMKADMGGGGAVLTALGAIAELGLPLRILAVVPACENMPGGRAYRPGDIVTALNGKTIEVTNTDAEGRLILADALWYTRQAGATHVLDLATLTGTMRVALGDFYAGLFGNDPDWVDEVGRAAEASGDHVWRWPAHRSYFRHIESSYADMKNCPEQKRGSSIIAALFLQEFAGEGPWAHIDMAATAFLDRARDYYEDVGATGYGVRLLAELASRISDRPTP